ncbi:MAG: type II secretion system protein GspD [Candidatus Binatia bacterium]
MRSDLLADSRRRRRIRRAVAVLGAAALLGAIVVVLQAYRPSPSPVAAVAVRSSAPKSAGELASAPTDDAASPPLAASALKTKPLSAWLGELARESGRDLVLSPELRGDLTASENGKLDWRTRLEAYARVSGFDYAVGEGLIEVRRGDPGGDAGKGGRDGAAASREPAARSVEAPAPVAAAPEPIPAETRVVRLVHAPAKDAATVLAKAAEALDVTATPDPSSNAVVLTGPPPGLQRALRVLAELDRPRRRILLEAKIVEVGRSARLDFGVEWKLAGTSVGGEVDFPPNVGDAGSAALLIATGGAAALDARISALEADGKLRVVSRPRVVMLEGSPATIESVRILRIRLPSRGAVVGDDIVESPTNDRATQDIPVGVRLEVTPAIRGGERVMLRIRAKSSSLGAPLPPDDIPEELSRMVDAEVLVTSGETAVLGGLSREASTRNSAGVPLLRNIPGVGNLFGRKAKDREEEELLVLVTPRVLD